MSLDTSTRGFGTVAVDFDNDGSVDLAVANGLVSRATPPQSPLRPGTSPWWAPWLASWSPSR